MTRSLAFQSISDVPGGVDGLGDGSKPELPELAIPSGRDQPIPVSRCQGFQPHTMSVEHDRGRDDHLRPRPEAAGGTPRAGSSRSQSMSKAGPSGVSTTEVARKPAFS